MAKTNAPKKAPSTTGKPSSGNIGNNNPAPLSTGGYKGNSSGGNSGKK